MAITYWTASFLDGWYPRLSPDGRYLLCGNSFLRVLDVATKTLLVEWRVPRYISQGWFGNSQACAANDDGVYRLDFPFTTPPTHIGPRQSFMGAGGGVWAGGTTQRIWVGDSFGHPVSIADGYAATVGRDGTVAYAIDVHTPQPKIVVWKSGQIQRTIVSKHATNRFICGTGGYVGLGIGNGPSWLNTPAGEEIEVGVTPERRESPPLHFPHLGTDWLATTDDFGVYLRPLGVRDRAIILSPKHGAIDCSVVSMGTYFLVASQDAVGNLTITTASADTPMLPVRPSVPVPPEPPVQAKATIESYETPIRVGGTSRAVIRITQGMPAKVRWQWQEGKEWRIGAENSPSDKDHTFNRPNGSWRNVFPSGPGRFPIRIQCLDKDGNVTDTSSSTSRVIVVEDTAPEPPIPPIPPIPPGPPGPVPDIHPAGKIFRAADNTPWRYKGVSAFKLGYLYETGTDIRPFLDAYRGFNVLRVWAYTDWVGSGWPRPTSPQSVADLAHFVAEYSSHLLEYTFLTNDSLEASDWAGQFARALAGTRMFGEIRNEPETHSQTVKTSRLKPAFDASGLVYASGNYEVSANAFGPYLVAHTERDSEWPRRAHDLMEYFDGKGPHKPTDPAHKVPCVADEPAKLEDVDKYVPSGVNRMAYLADDWRAYFGTAALLGAGATFHSETGKYALPPTTEERILAAAALEGLNAFPADAPLGAYARPTDKSLRTYTIDNRYMVRVRPTTPSPGGAWQRIGSSNVLWHK